MLSTNTGGALLLSYRNAVIYRAGGAIGSAIARAFAREDARIFPTGRTLATLDRLAKGIVASGGDAETAQVEALDDPAVEKHLGEVVRKNGGIDVSFNATG